MCNRHLVFAADGKLSGFGKGMFVTKPLDTLGLAASLIKGRQELDGVASKSDQLVKDAVVANGLLLSGSVFLRAFKSGKANVS